MHIAIINAKGGNGKTTLSVALAKEIHAAVVTNDPLTRLEKVLPARSVLKLLPDDHTPSIPNEQNVIWDIGGGFTDHRVPNILRKSNLVVVPIKFENINDWTVSRATLTSVQKYNSNIVIVINAVTDQNDLKKIIEAINNAFPTLPYLVLKKRKALKEMLNGGAGISQRSITSGLARRQLESVKDVLNNIIGMAE